MRASKSTASDGFSRSVDAMWPRYLHRPRRRGLLPPDVGCPGTSRTPGCHCPEKTAAARRWTFLPVRWPSASSEAVDRPVEKWPGRSPGALGCIVDRAGGQVSRPSPWFVSRSRSGPSCTTYKLQRVFRCRQATHARDTRLSFRMVPSATASSRFMLGPMVGDWWWWNELPAAGRMSSCQYPLVTWATNYSTAEMWRFST